MIADPPRLLPTPEMRKLLFACGFGITDPGGRSFNMSRTLRFIVEMLVRSGTASKVKVLMSSNHE